MEVCGSQSLKYITSAFVYLWRRPYTSQIFILTVVDLLELSGELTPHFLHLSLQLLLMVNGMSMALHKHLYRDVLA